MKKIQIQIPLVAAVFIFALFSFVPSTFAQYDGEFYGPSDSGGEFYGPADSGGQFYGTPSYGGEFYGAPSYGGEFYGPQTYGGEFYGTPNYGGEFYGPQNNTAPNYGGEFYGALNPNYGGEFYGPQNYGGEFYGPQNQYAGTPNYGGEFYGPQNPYTGTPNYGGEFYGPTQSPPTALTPFPSAPAPQYEGCGDYCYRSPTLYGYSAAYGLGGTQYAPTSLYGMNYPSGYSDYYSPSSYPSYTYPTYYSYPVNYAPTYPVYTPTYSPVQVPIQVPIIIAPQIIPAAVIKPTCNIFFVPTNNPQTKGLVWNSSSASYGTISPSIGTVSGAGYIEVSANTMHYTLTVYGNSGGVSSCSTN